MERKTAVLGVLALGALRLGTVSAQTPQSDTGNPPPKHGFFSTLAQPFRQAVDPMVVRGYVDVGSQRYYCVKDAKTGDNQLNAVQGQLLPPDNGVTGIRITSTSIVDCDKMERQGRLVTAGYAVPTASRDGGGTVSATAPAPSRLDVDTSKWNIVGIKLGDTSEAAALAVSKTYPKAVRVDHEVHYTYKQFSTPLLVLGTQYVAGKAVSPLFIHPKEGPVTGAKELGDESDTIDIEYIWPSKGTIAAIQRTHLYDSSRRLDPRTLPSVDSVKQTLIERFGPPAATNTTEATSHVPGIFIGGSFPTVTWTWVDSPASLRGNQVAPRCLDWHIFQFSNRNDPPTIIRPDASCGTFLIVSVDIVQNDYVESVTQQLVDDKAASQAFLALGTYLQTGQSNESTAIKARADATKPTL